MKFSLVVITIGVSLFVATGCVLRSQNRQGEAKVASQILASNLKAALEFQEIHQATRVAESIAEVDQFVFDVILDHEEEVFAEYFRPSV